MARVYRPEIVAKIEARQEPGVAGPMMGGPPLKEANPEQLEVLQVLVDHLYETELPKGEGKDKVSAAELILGNESEVVITLRRSDPGEVWVRVDT